MEFTRDELLWINNALAAVVGGPEAIDDGEFHALIGGHRDEVRELLRKTSDLVGELQRADPEW